MSELLPISIGIGLAVSLIFSELLGLAVGGMVVPGYIALHLTQPISVIMTLVASVITFLIVRWLSSITIIYGKRRAAITILVGYLMGAALTSFSPGATSVGEGIEVSVIGFIIPGLIAIWIDRQGLFETLSSLLTVSVAVRLIIILLIGMGLEP